ncbi:MAG: hypothetical protein K9L28_10160 [Synergistales bacterium]|nr:hypothetical protein [Synergistales bacterium]
MAQENRPQQRKQQQKKNNNKDWFAEIFGKDQHSMYVTIGVIVVAILAIYAIVNVGSVQSGVNAQLAAVEETLSEQSKLIDTMAQRIETLKEEGVESGQEEVKKLAATMDRQFKVLSKQIQTNAGRVADLEQQLKAMDTTMEKVRANLAELSKQEQEQKSEGTGVSTEFLRQQLANRMQRNQKMLEMFEEAVSTDQRLLEELQ